VNAYSEQKVIESLPRMQVGKNNLGVDGYKTIWLTFFNKNYWNCTLLNNETIELAIKSEFTEYLSKILSEIIYSQFHLALLIILFSVNLIKIICKLMYEL
jgi:hypothetical protein